MSLISILPIGDHESANPCFPFLIISTTWVLEIRVIVPLNIFNNKQATLMLHVWGNALSVLEKKKWLYQWQIIVALVKKKNFVVVILSILRFNSQKNYLNKDKVTLFKEL